MRTIEFSGKFDCIICLAGILPKAKVFDKLQGIPIFAADGSVFNLEKIGVEAEKIIGDLDTFYANPDNIKFPKDKLVHIAEQETNDFEKTLQFAMEAGYRNCLILGIDGGEFEHSLNNWSIFIRYSSKLNLCICTENRYGFVVREDVMLRLKKDEIISLIPQPKATLTTQNLKWSLLKESLELGAREGARNLTTNDEITINLHSGSLTVFVEARLPLSPIYK